MFGGMLLNNFVAGQYVNCAICEAQYSACKNYVLCKPECVGNYSIPSANGNVESADSLAGAGILSFLNIYVRLLLMLLIILLIILGFGVAFLQLYINDSYPNCQFAGLTYTGQCYCYNVLLFPERDQLQNCLDIAPAKLENWLKANKHTKLNHMCYKQ